MKMTEFLTVKEMKYLEYCDYLQEKYGIGLADYMTKSFNKNQKVSRTSDGLIAHHKAEDKMIMLSTKAIAEMCPYEWQIKENIVYCDYLEHLLLHVLICMYPSPDKMPMADVGIGGVVNFIVPELNDLYSGWKSKQNWRVNCYKKVVEDKGVYLEILKMFIAYLIVDRDFNDKDILHTSFNEQFGGWSSKQNEALYEEIDRNWENLKEDKIANQIKYCNCKGHRSITMGFDDEFGYWDVCVDCGKKIEEGYHYYNHYDGEDHEEFWGSDGDILD